MVQLTAHFDTDMFSATQHTSLLAQNRAEALQPLVLSNLKKLAELSEEVLANVFPNGINVHDAYRCQALNTAVQGAATSQHCVGQAVDMMPIGYENDLPMALFLLAVWGMHNQPSPKFGQLLIENGCIHYSLPRGHADGEVAFWQPGNKQIWRPGA